MRGALRPEAPGLVGQDRQPGVRELPAVLQPTCGRRAVRSTSSANGSSPRSGPARWTRTSSGRHQARSTSASTSGSATSGFTGAIDWYDKKTDDLIFTVPVAAGTNLSNFVTTNIGSMRNRGIELSLSARVLDGGQRGLELDRPTSPRRTTATSCSHQSVRRRRASEILVGGIAGGVGTNPGAQAGRSRSTRSSSTSTSATRTASRSTPMRTATARSTTRTCTSTRTATATSTRTIAGPFHDPAPNWILGHSSYLAVGQLRSRLHPAGVPGELRRTTTSRPTSAPTPR